MVRVDQVSGMLNLLAYVVVALVVIFVLWHAMLVATSQTPTDWINGFVEDIREAFTLYPMG